MRHFDVAHHQPHPPGYPLFILAANMAHTIVKPEASALGAVSVVAAALGIVAMFALVRRLFEPSAALIATLFAATTPLYWFTAVRPLSDSLGLTAALTVQALIVGAETHNVLIAATFLAALGAGIRSQVLWLTVPLLVAHGSVAHGFSRAKATTAIAFVAGIFVWFVPLILLSGGPAAYWHALFDQGAEDLSGIQMLWTSPRLRTLIDALYYAFAAPWATWTLAIPVLLAAAAGAVILARRNPRALALLAVAFGPYLLFDVLFQETFTVRYALPLVIPVAALAAVAVASLPQPLVFAAVLPIAMYGAHIGGRSIAEYSRQPAPVFRMLADMRAASPSGSSPTLAPDRRASFDLRRPLAWLGPAAPAFDRQLPSPPQHEWLEAARFWSGGGRGPFWFVVDPRRAAIDLVQHGAPRSYGYVLPHPVLMSGTRPADLDWYQVDRPDWFVGEGWALTPESAGVADADHKGLAFGPIEGWIRSDVDVVMIGGRNFEPTIRPKLEVTIDGRSTRSIEPAAGFFVDYVGQPDPPANRRSDYVKITIQSTPPARVAIEQFDAPASLAFGAGWHEQEFNPQTGQRWRWLSERSELQVIPADQPLTLHITGESPRKYYARGSRLTFRWRDQMLLDTVVHDDFSIDVPLTGLSRDRVAAAGPQVVVVETDQTHVPAERSWRGATDRRHLGLRIYACELRVATASAPDKAASSQPVR